MNSLKDLNISVESGINVKDNKAEIYVVDKDWLESVMKNGNIELPNKVELIRTPSLREPLINIDIV